MSLMDEFKKIIHPYDDEDDDFEDFDEPAPKEPFEDRRAKMAEERGIAESGYRLIVNTGHDGAQTVMHLHLHVLGGKALTEQMAHLTELYRRTR